MIIFHLIFSFEMFVNFFFEYIGLEILLYLKMIWFLDI